MPKNKKNKPFIYVLLLCLLYMGGQQRVWGQTTEIDRPEPFITVKRVHSKDPAYIYYEFDTNHQLAKSLTLQNLFTEYLYLLPPANPADTFVIVDTVNNDRSYFFKEYKTCTSCVSYIYQQYHKGYLVKNADFRIDLNNQRVVRIAGRIVPNLDADTTNVMSKEESVKRGCTIAIEYNTQIGFVADSQAYIKNKERFLQHHLQHDFRTEVTDYSLMPFEFLKDVYNDSLSYLIVFSPPIGTLIHVRMNAITGQVNLAQPGRH